ncbi:isocitrate dehydrogenase [NAD] subunit gamma, mitochondrial-like [Ornithodoros turicata]|uniref:isocitrate dehydrogenase [NAD] subunit gamma, mitochondrial-like n=1 Tax=Ornithodoros turicata TaxID=34597 RepID=UPI0031388CBA
MAFASRALPQRWNSLRCAYTQQRRTTYSKYGGRFFVTMLPGHGIGPEMMNHVEAVFAAAKVPVDFEKIYINPKAADPVNMAHAISSIRRNGVGLKGNIETPFDRPDLEPRNLILRNELDLYVNVVHCRSQPGVQTRHKNIDVVIIRQNTEGEYSCLEHAVHVEKGEMVECLKVITRKRSEQIAHYAFHYATTHKKRKLTVIHKANIMKLSDGLFLQCCREISKAYPTIELEDMIIDNCCMQIVSDPNQFDVLLVPNLYGNIVVNVFCGLVGGPGITSGRNYGNEYAVFETATRNTGTRLAGKNAANPVATLFASVDMLKHLGLRDHAFKIKTAVEGALAEKKLHTQDLGGMAKTTDVVQRIIQELEKDTR